MSNIINYEPNDIIYEKGSSHKFIYGLRVGLIHLVSDTSGGQENAQHIHPVNVDDFFGIEYAITNCPQHESAIVIEKSTVISYTIGEFKGIMLKQEDAMVSALRSLSKKLRNLNAIAKKVVGEDSDANQLEAMLSIGEDLYQRSEFKQAQYIFETYLNQHTEGKNKERVKFMLKNIRNGDPYLAESLPPLQLEIEQKDSGRPNKKSLAQTAQPGQPIHVMKKNLQDGIQLFKQEAYAKSAACLQSIIDEREKNKSTDAPSLSAHSIAQSEKNLQDPSTQQAYLYKGLAEWHLQKFDTAIVTLSRYLARYPKGLFWEAAILHLGQLMEKKKNTKKAKFFYRYLIRNPSHHKKNATPANATSAISTGRIDSDIHTNANTPSTEKNMSRFALAAKKYMEKIEKIEKRHHIQ